MRTSPAPGIHPGMTSGVAAPVLSSCQLWPRATPPLQHVHPRAAAAGACVLHASNLVRAVTLSGQPTQPLTLVPNPAPAGHGRATTLAGATPGTSVAVYDALGRLVRTATADATGSARLTLPAALPTGVYLVRTGTRALRLAVEE